MNLVHGEVAMLFAQCRSNGSIAKVRSSLEDGDVATWLACTAADGALGGERPYDDRWRDDPCAVTIGQRCGSIAKMILAPRSESRDYLVGCRDA